MHIIAVSSYELRLRNYGTKVAKKKIHDKYIQIQFIK